MAKKQSLDKKNQMKARNAQRKQERAKAESALLYRCLGMLSVLAIAEIYFLLTYRFLVQGTARSMAAMAEFNGAMVWVGLAAAVVGVVLMVVKRGKKAAHWGGWIAMLGVIVCIGSRLAITIFPTGTAVMCVAVPLLALACFVYFLYQREFFFSGLGMGLAAAGMWLSRRAADSAYWSTKYLVIEAVLLIAVLVLLFLAVKIGRSGGKWGKEETTAVFSDSTNYAVVYGTLGIAAVMLVVGSFVPALALYLMWAGIALLFVLAVYYTMHLM